MTNILPSELHIWITNPDTISADQLYRQYFLLLDQEESENYQRFYFVHDRLNYLAAHALLRIALSNYAKFQPEQWQFVREQFGKPKIVLSPELPPLSFNMSHTRGMVACIIGNDCQCGIDIEELRPINDANAVAEIVFSDKEIAYLESLVESERRSSFFLFWTLKEAYSKALGLGFSAPLRQISFSLNHSNITAISDTGTGIDSTEWIFLQCKPSNMHQLAIAAKSKNRITTIIYRNFDLSNGTFENMIF